MTSFQAPDFKTISFKLQKKKKKINFHIKEIEQQNSQRPQSIKHNFKKNPVKVYIGKEKNQPVFQSIPKNAYPTESCNQQERRNLEVRR